MDILVQFLNPEILKLYGVSLNSLNNKYYNKLIDLFKISTLLLDQKGKLIFPASYFAEVPFIKKLLRDLSALSNSSLIYYSSPSADLNIYSNIKKKNIIIPICIYLIIISPIILIIYAMKLYGFQK